MFIFRLMSSCILLRDLKFRRGCLIIFTSLRVPNAWVTGASRVPFFANVLVMGAVFTFRLTSCWMDPTCVIVG